MNSQEKIKVSIIGASGYVGGELLRLLLFHPGVEISQVTSNSHAGKPIWTIHPNLRGATDLKFIPEEELKPCELMFFALPHGELAKRIDEFLSLSPKIIDLSADFRLKNQKDYEKWYKFSHPKPKLLGKFIYGLAELHRKELRKADFVAIGGCNATAVILALYPLYKRNLVSSCGTVVEVKVGTSESGSRPSIASHHPERRNSIRCYKPTGHRHLAEIRQELFLDENESFYMSATALDMVRGIQAVAHVFLEEEIEEKQLWKTYREDYGEEPFIRIVKAKEGIYRYPDPKLLWGTNFCDIGFEIEFNSKRLVVISAIDNLLKGAAGQALQAFNIMMGFKENEGLNFYGLHPA